MRGSSPGIRVNVGQLLEGATHARVERVLLRAVKDMVLEGRALELGIEHVDRARRREESRLRLALAG